MWVFSHFAFRGVFGESYDNAKTIYDKVKIQNFWILIKFLTQPVSL